MIYMCRDVQAGDRRTRFFGQTTIELARRRNREDHYFSDNDVVAVRFENSIHFGYIWQITSSKLQYKPLGRQGTTRDTRARRAPSHGNVAPTLTVDREMVANIVGAIIRHPLIRAYVTELIHAYLVACNTRSARSISGPSLETLQTSQPRLPITTSGMYIVKTCIRNIRQLSISSTACCSPITPLTSMLDANRSVDSSSTCVLFDDAGTAIIQSTLDRLQEATQNSTRLEVTAEGEVGEDQPDDGGSGDMHGLDGCPFKVVNKNKKWCQIRTGVILQPMLGALILWNCVHKN